VLGYARELVDKTQGHRLEAILVDNYDDTCMFSTLAGCYFLFEEFRSLNPAPRRNPRLPSRIPEGGSRCTGSRKAGQARAGKVTKVPFSESRF